MEEKITKELIKEMIYQIKGEEVMFDFDLAKIFGYETKALNKQVKNNLNLFDEKDRFKIETEEWNIILRCKNFTANVTANFLSKRRTLPYAFTEKGILMLTRILKPKTDECKENVEFLINNFKGDNPLVTAEKTDDNALNYEIVKFESGEISLDIRVSPDEETVWLNKEQIVILFETTRQNVEYHITNIYSQNELEIGATCKEILQVQLENNRQVTRTIKNYNLEMIISIGFRVNSRRGIEFRRWANNLLKQYLIKGYSINSKRCLEHSDIILKLQNETNQLLTKMDKYDNKFKSIKKDITKIKQYFNDSSTYKHFLILNGKRLEAAIVYQSIFKLAKKSIYIIDDYIDIKTLQLLKVCDKSIEIIIFTDNKGTNNLTKRIVNDFKKDSDINVILKRNDKTFHDRYIIIDFNTSNELLYHSGASLKDAGGNISAIDKIEKSELYKDVIKKLLENDYLKLS